MKFILLFLLILSNILVAETTIKGYIKDKQTNEIIVGAAIVKEGFGIAVSDSSGFYSLKLNTGKHTLTAKMLGYKPEVKTITVEEDEEEITLFFYLKPQPIEIEKVTVFGDKFTETEKYKTYQLNQGELKNIPVFIESDPIRAVQALPGVTQSHDFSDLIFLRGGNFDETLITLNEVPIYNPHHAGGVYSIFNTDMIEREILYPSNYPLEFSNALSGVLSIHTKSGNRERMSGTASIGLLSSRGFLEGNLGKGSFFISARRTYPDLIFNLFTDFPYYFYDFNGKFTLPFDDKNLISAEFFYSKDIYELYQGGNIIYKNEDLNWGNKIAKVSFEHLFDLGSVELTTYYSESRAGADAESAPGDNWYYDSSGEIVGNEHIIIDNYIKDYSAKAKLKLNFTGLQTVISVQYNKLKVNSFWDIYDNQISTDINGNVQDVFFDFAPAQYNSNDNEDIVSAYLSNEIILTPKLSTILGYRGIYLNSINNILHSPFGLLTYKFNKEIELNLSFGRYYQYLYSKKDLIYSTTFAPFAAYFLPETSDEVRTSNHYSLGFNWNDILPGYNFESEVYYKTRNNLPSSDEVTKTTTYVDGYAAGVDLLLKKTEGFITGWLIYSFSRSVKDKGYEYYASYDRTHTIKALLNLNLSETWQFNAFWIYATGLPYTPAVGKYLSGDYYGGGEINVFEWELYYGRKNTVRYSPYTRLDVGITGRFIWWGIAAKPYLQVLNVYRSKNSFDYDPRPSDTSVHDGTNQGSEIIPTIGITLEF